ncbi:MAG: hypothetical protein LIP09_10535 [Bacteroidales bacterium]|nr:hypothetical protein [Bacteroidales bacterium]
MNLQKTFKESYMKELRDNVVSEVNLPLYGQETFELGPSQIKRLANVYEPEGLEKKMEGLENDDFKAAITLYEAFPNISPLLASTEAFWSYLCHTSLFHYAQKRWPAVMDGDVTSDYILDHWFVGRQGLLRNAGASLWWGIHNTIDEERQNPYELSQILFDNYNFRIINFGRSLLIRHKEAMIGILQFCLDNKQELSHAFDPRAKFISIYFNRLGGTKQLSSLNRDFFYSECERIKDRIMSITSREQVTNADEVFSV